MKVTKKVIRFLSQIACVVFMLIGAELEAENGFGWSQFFGLVIFSIALIIWSNIIRHEQYIKNVDYIHFWIYRYWVEQIYRKCDDGNDEFDIDVPNAIADEFTQHIGHNQPYFTSKGFKYTYVITKGIVRENSYTTITFTKIKNYKENKIS